MLRKAGLVIGGAILRRLPLTEEVWRMDAQQRARAAKHHAPAKLAQLQRGGRQIVIAMTRAEYDQSWSAPAVVRRRIQQQFRRAPELFPVSFERGFTLDGLLRESKKLSGVRLRKITLCDGSIYELRPSFVLPDMLGSRNF